MKYLKIDTLDKGWRDRDVWEEIKSLYAWWKKVRPARRNPLDDKSITIPPLETRQIPGSEYCELVPPDRKKYAAYYRATRKLNRIEKNWLEEDQRILHRLIEIRKFLWM